MLWCWGRSREALICLNEFPDKSLRATAPELVNLRHSVRLAHRRKAVEIAFSVSPKHDLADILIGRIFGQIVPCELGAHSAKSRG